jgi:hypothetical protein
MMSDFLHFSPLESVFFTLWKLLLLSVHLSIYDVICVRATKSISRNQHETQNVILGDFMHRMHRVTQGGVIMRPPA